MTRRLLLPLAALAAACGPAAQTALPLDVRVAIPAPDPGYVDFVGSDFEVPAGKEVMTCLHLRYDGDDQAFSMMKTLQGKFGHHAVLLTALNPQPPGTLEDCSDVGEMGKYDAYTIGDLELPAGYGSFLPHGKAIVLQSHYVNTGKQPILARDVLRVRKMELAQVQKWAAIVTTNLLTFEVPPHAVGVTRSFDCTVPSDVELLAFGGHMHEYGTKMSIELGPDAAHLATEYSVPEWKADYRDNPPMNLYTTAPKPVAAGSLVRVSCTWDNPTDGALGFPREMCASFGFVGGTREPVVCRAQGN